MDNKSYIIAIDDDSDFYIPNAEHIERNDDLMLVEDDAEAAIEAEKDGIKLIYNMVGVPNGVYLDTEENREIIVEMLEKYPEYKKWGYTKYEIWNEVKGDFEVDKISTRILISKMPYVDIEWRINDIGMEVLTLDEILEQIIKIIPSQQIGCIRILYESGLWGVIFETGNYIEKYDTWIVHGITKGDA